jgi:mono/diheme cytochrome c family protein
LREINLFCGSELTVNCVRIGFFSMRLSCGLAALMTAAFAIDAVAEEPGDALAGLAYANQVCSECHAVKEADERSPNPDAPSFASVARTPGMTGRALAVWLQTSHPKMPNIMLEQDDRDNVIAYIMSMRPVPPQ